MARNAKVLSYNVKMLPGLVGNGKADLQRASKIVAALKAARYDVVCLQEVFSEDARDVFVKGLKGSHPHQVPKVHDGDLFHDDSGLFFASKFPIKGAGTAWKYQEWDKCRGSDCWADKGVFSARLDLGGDWTLVVFNVHLQSDPSVVGENRRSRRNQLRQLAKFMRWRLGDVAQPDRTAALLVGDFNLHSATPEYTALPRYLGPHRDLFVEKNPGESGITWDGGNNHMIPRGDRDQLRLDYVFAMNAIPGANVYLFRPVCASSRVNPFGGTPRLRLSDHYGVEARIRL